MQHGKNTLYDFHIAEGIRENRTFSDLLLVMDTVLDPTDFPNIKDKPRHQQYHIESENIEAFAQKINGNLKKFYTVIKSNNASFTHIDVHFGKGGDNSASTLENAAASKRKEYQAVNESFLEIVKVLRKAPGPRSEKAVMLCDIEKLRQTISTKPNIVTFGVNYDGFFT